MFLLHVIGLGTFSIQRLSDVNRISDEIRSQWLQHTRLLGDLNNYMSGYRTGEATHLLSNTALNLALANAPAGLCLCFDTDRFGAHRMAGLGQSSAAGLHYFGRERSGFDHK